MELGGGIYGEEVIGKNPENVRGQRASEAANSFADAESLASGNAPKVNDNTTSGSTDIAENGEAIHTPRYGSGPALAGAAAGGGAVAMAAKTTPMGRIASMFKGSGNGNNASKKPFIAMAGLIGTIAVLMLGVSSLLPIHLISNMTDLKNSFNTVSDRRTTRLIRRVIGKENSQAYNTWKQRNRLSPKRMNQLNKNLEVEGFRFEPNAFDDSIRLTTNRNLNTGEVDINPITGEVMWTTVANGDIEFAQLMANNPDMRSAFNRGSRTMRGPIAGWFNKAAAFWLKIKLMVRNVFKDFIGGTDGNGVKSAARDKLATQENKVAIDDMALASTTTEHDSDSDSSTTTSSNSGAINKRNGIDPAKAKIIEDIQARAQGIAKKLNIVNAVVCGVTLAVAAAAAVLTADQMARGLQVVGGWFEAGQKVKAGDGDDSYHAFGEMLTDSVTTNYIDDNGNEAVARGGAKSSATESAGLTQVLVGGTFSAEDDVSAIKYHAEKAVKYLGVMMGGVAACTASNLVLSIASGLLDIASTIIMFIPGVGQAFSLGKFLLQTGANIALSEGISRVVAAVGPAIGTFLATMLVTKIATDVGGEDFGNLVASIGGRYMAGAHQANGGVVATKENALVYYRETQAVLAEQAEQDRFDHSPFDVTNRNTFLGSIAFKMSGFAYTSGSLLGDFNGLANVAKISGLPWNISASAADSIAFRESLGNCPQLSTLYPQGATDDSGKVNSVACDLFGNPMRVNDMTMVDYDPEFIFWKTAYTCDGNNCSFGKKQSTRTNSDGTVVTAEQYEEAQSRNGVNLDGAPWPETLKDPVANCSKTNGVCNGNWYEILKIDTDSNGLETVNRKSDLGKMIEYGVNRQTDPGMSDVNIMMAEDGSLDGGWVGGIPVIGSINSFISALDQEKALQGGWVDGKAYCQGCTPEWEAKYKYLNQYIVDNNLYENMGAIERSPVVAFLEDVIYPEMDMSPEGVLARNVGMPKGFVVSTLAWIEDMINTPKSADSLIASAPNIYSTYYGGWSSNELTMPEDNDPCRILDSARECTRIAGTELRRRFNAEAVA
jgi:hypothetical protein